MISPALFSSKTDQHATPRALAAEIVAEFGITLDVCADASNAVVPDYFTKEQDGLLKYEEGAWKGQNVYCNPPYGRGVDKWIHLCWSAGRYPWSPSLAVMLLPARTDTRWFHEFMWNRDLVRPRPEIRFFKGRLKFGDAKNAAPFPSMLAVFR